MYPLGYATAVWVIVCYDAFYWTIYIKKYVKQTLFYCMEAGE